MLEEVSHYYVADQLHGCEDTCSKGRDARESIRALGLTTHVVINDYTTARHTERAQRLTNFIGTTVSKLS